MNKQDYMFKLENMLAEFDAGIRDEIMSDYEEHFEMGALEGKSEEQIAQELGSIEELVADLRSMSKEDKDMAVFSDETHDKVKEVVKNFATVIGEIAAGVAKGTAKVTGAVGDGTKDLATDIVSGVTKGYENLAQGVGDFAGKVSEKTGKFVKEVSDSYHRSMNKDTAKAASDVDDIGEILDDAADKLEKAVNDAEAEIDRLADTDFELDESKAGENEVNKDANAAGDNTGTEGACGDAQAEKDGAVQEGTVNADDIREGLKSAVRDLGTALGDVIDSMRDTISGLFSSDSKAENAASGNAAENPEAGAASDMTVRAGSPDETDAEYDELNDDGSEFAAFDSNVEAVVIEANGGEIVVDSDGSDELTFNYTNDGTESQKLAYGFDVKQVGKTVYASIKRRPGTANFFNSLNWPDTELYVGLSNAVKKVSIRTMSGEVEVNEVQLDQLDINSMSGEAEITDAKVTAADISTMSGDIDLTDCEFGVLSVSSVSGDTDFSGTAGSIHAKTTSGDVELELESRSDITASSVSGDINIRFDDCAGYVAQVSTTSGDITLCCGDEEKSVIRSGSYILGNGDSKLKLNSVSGDIVVEG
ncbi:MAG: DUF4097 family beta strand repeat-containing protein [Lachnospiraceae bacterium]|nr:DUF4097 family beta strand repeat-containing protein [Lachnospiraceae bacterium]